MKIYKKLVSAVCALALLPIPAAFAGSIDGLSENTAEIYIIDDDGKVFDGAGTRLDTTGDYVTYTASTTQKSKSVAYRGAYNEVYLYNEGSNVTGTYKAEVTGLYEVFVAIPIVASTASSGRMGVTVTNGTTESTEVILGHNKGSESATNWNDGEWQSVGVYDFEGEGDTVQLTHYFVDTDVYTEFGKQQIANFDAVKLVKYNSIEDKISSVIVDETGKSWVNGSETWSEKNGYVNIQGNIVAIGNVSGASKMMRYDSLYSRSRGWSTAVDYGGQFWQTEDSDPISVIYYPKLNPGNYKLYVWGPRDPGAYPNRMNISTSDLTKTPVTDKVLRITGGFLEIGEYSFTGEYGKDYVKLTSNCDGEGNFVTYFDAVKLVRVGGVGSEDAEIAMKSVSDIDTENNSVKLNLDTNEFAASVTADNILTENMPQGFSISSVERISDSEIKVTFAGTAATAIENDITFKMGVKAAAMADCTVNSDMIAVTVKAPVHKILVTASANVTDTEVLVSGASKNISADTISGHVLLIGLYKDGKMLDYKVVPQGSLASLAESQYSETFTGAGFAGAQVKIFAWDAVPQVDTAGGGVILAEETVE